MLTRLTVEKNNLITSRAVKLERPFNNPICCGKSLYRKAESFQYLAFFPQLRRDFGPGTLFTWRRTRNEYVAVMSVGQ